MSYLEFDERKFRKKAGRNHLRNDSPRQMSISNLKMLVEDLIFEDQRDQSLSCENENNLFTILAELLMILLMNFRKLLVLFVVKFIGFSFYICSQIKICFSSSFNTSKFDFFKYD